MTNDENFRKQQEERLREEQRRREEELRRERERDAERRKNQREDGGTRGRPTDERPDRGD